METAGQAEPTPTQQGVEETALEEGQCYVHSEFEHQLWKVVLDNDGNQKKVLVGPTHPHSTSPPPAEEQKGETPMELEEEDSCSSLPTPVGGGGEKDPVETSTHTQGEGNTSGNTSPPTPDSGWGG